MAEGEDIDDEVDRLLREIEKDTSGGEQRVVEEKKVWVNVQKS